MNNSTNPTTQNKGLWAKLAVNYYDNPKFDSVSPLAELLYVRSISFAKTENTGVLSLKAGARLAFDLGDHSLLIEELLDAGLWSRVDDGVMITNWHEWQEDSGRVEAKREQGRLNAHKRYHAVKADPSCTYCNSDGSPNGLLNGSPNGSDATTPMEEKSREEKSKSREEISITSNEAKELCNLLSELMIGNGCKPPTINKTWLSEMDKLLRIDERPFSEAEEVLRFCQQDSFWKSNIHSPIKFRAKYDALRMKMRSPSSGESMRERQLREAADRVRKWQDEEQTAIGEFFTPKEIGQ